MHRLAKVLTLVLFLAALSGAAEDPVAAEARLVIQKWVQSMNDGSKEEYLSCVTPHGRMYEGLNHADWTKMGKQHILVHDLALVGHDDSFAFMRFEGEETIGHHPIHMYVALKWVVVQEKRHLYINSLLDVDKDP